ncbi:acyltransferase [Lysobacter arvi]|uniref:LpxL/LpxP family acyltransferase n=1 Tax=Lysobacter arvi TaxID=3038776 RepID=UPI00283AA049|nr:acyltransferase [Lysobacter arvi]
MSAHWKQRPEGGGYFALWIIRSIARHGGRAVARLCLYPITLYFLIVRGPERRASRAYLSRVLDRAPTLWDVARHIHTFAATILDRVFLLSGQLSRFDIATVGLPALAARVDRGEGVLIFGSHHGSFDALRVLSLTRPALRVRIVLDIAHNQAITRLLDALNPQLARDVIDAGQDGVSIVLAIQEALARGELVALLVDRAEPGDTVVRVPFLGKAAALPTGPWSLAATLKVPIVLAFGLYRGGNRYELVFEEFSEGLDIPRRQRGERLAALVRDYAARLQHHVRRAPYNWFNFYDFWQGDDAADDSSLARPGEAAGADLAAAGQRRDLRRAG